MTNSPQHPLAGSERHPLHGARATGAADPNERLEVTVVVRSRNTGALTQHLKQAAAGAFLTREEFERDHGADSADLAAVAAFARAHNLAVVDQSAARRSVVLSGTVANFNQAFNVDLQTYEQPHGTYRGR